MAEIRQVISGITVGGYKSIRDKKTINIRPLTILAGANSSGKSSIMQPTLMMKQTLDASYDPGQLLLNGPNIRFTQLEQFMPIDSAASNELVAGFEISGTADFSCMSHFQKSEEGPIRQFDISSMNVSSDEEEFTLTPEMSEKDLRARGPKMVRRFGKGKDDKERNIENKFRIVSSRCFLHIEYYNEKIDLDFSKLIPFVLFSPDLRPNVRQLIHLPGLRGIPERVYPVAAAQGPNFKGTFENYVASLVLRWQQEGNDKLLKIAKDLADLGITKWVKAKTVDDSSVELRVGRMPVINEETSDLDGVSIADVGIGVSQVLPVLVALVAAEPDQLVYIEQPELHLHPKAQVALASVMADAAKRGVRVVAETHSSLLLQGVMTLIAKDRLDHQDVMLHWFTRDDEGNTRVNSVEPDEKGAYGDWPVDFADIRLTEQRRYLDAVARRKMGLVNDPA